MRPHRPAAVLAVLLGLAAGALPVRAGTAGLDETLRTADVVILGELHDDPRHHERQGALIRRMVELGRRPAVVFEMIPADLQAPLDAALDAGRTEDLGAVLRWRERGWGDFALYAPVFAAALDAGLPIRAGDLTVAERKAAGAGALSAERRTALGLDAPLPPPAEAALGDALVAAHCGQLPRSAVGPMIAVQRARDGSMADAVRRAAADGPVVLITGQGHARRDWGVPSVLARTAPDLAVASIALSADGTAPQTDAEGAYDRIEATGPPPERGDPCEDLR